MQPYQNQADTLSAKIQSTVYKYLSEHMPYIPHDMLTSIAQRAIADAQQRIANEQSISAYTGPPKQLTGKHLDISI